jgi:MerR family transcriptional regulator, copper efflux regulator
MNISAASDRSGLPAKTIRYYDEIGLVRPQRRDNNYRDYSDRDLHTLRFLHRARGLGFTIEECRSLLTLYEDRNRASADVRALALGRISDIDRKIEELKSLRATLNALIAACHGDHRPDCPILDDLAGKRG